MGPKKLSGAQNRKRRALTDLEDQKSAGVIKKYFGTPTPSGLQTREEKDDESCSSQSDVHPKLSEPSTSKTSLEEEDSFTPSGPVAFDETISTCENSSFTDPALISKNLDSILDVGPVQVQDIDFKKDAYNQHVSSAFYKRKLDSGEEQTRRWLVYSSSANKVFCFSCKLFDKNPKTSLTLGGSDDSTNMSNILKSHEASSGHFTAQQMWTETQLRRNSKHAIDQNYQNLMSRERQHWRSVMERLLNIVQFLAERNLAFRSSSERLFTTNNGNFLGLVELLGKYDSVMAEHLRRVVSKETADHYCGKIIQNEIINLMAKQKKKALFDYESQDEPLTDPTKKFKIDFFYVLVDTAAKSLEERFSQMEQHNKVWRFLYNMRHLPARENLRDCCLQLQKALEKSRQSAINGLDLSEELWHIQSLPPQDATAPRHILNFIVRNGLTDTFPNIWIAFQILLTIPVSVASGERSFSKLKLIKTYLRLTSLSVLSIESDVLKTLDMNNMIDEFAKTKARDGRGEEEGAQD
ncbi:zinc finger MYM-type 1-like [Pelobates cultripes]|uniref:Zinc finger MYM-type 1-like n=1 Tax=Pelobates cultripes TaxID=61616 RepID=A0AAD1SIZ2_PELCU|nr:zinc finger MYM-type 1-like [Pelobates cultripes]